jgi:hypothetical protein
MHKGRYHYQYPYTTALFLPEFSPHFHKLVSGVLSIHIRDRVADLCGSNSEILKCCEINIEHFTSLFVKRLFLISGLVTHDPTREHQLVVASSTGTGLCCCLYLPHREVRLWERKEGRDHPCFIWRGREEGWSGWSLIIWHKKWVFSTKFVPWLAMSWIQNSFGKRFDI